MDSDEEDSAEEDDEGASPGNGADAGIFDDDDPGFEGDDDASQQKESISYLFAFRTVFLHVSTNKYFVFNSSTKSILLCNGIFRPINI